MYDSKSNRDVPIAKAILDAHGEVRWLTELANRAVHEAVVAMVSYRDPLAPTIFGADAEGLAMLADASRAKLDELFQAGVSIFGLRMADDAFESALAAGSDPDACFRKLLSTFAQPLPIKCLLSSSQAERDIPVSQAMLDVHDEVRHKIEAANRAVYAAVVSMVHSGDPLAPMVFNVGMAHLRALALTSKARLNTLLMTGVPVFTLRLSQDVLNSVTGKVHDPDACLRMMLATLL